VDPRSVTVAGASDEETAAVVAAVERFMLENAPAAAVAVAPAVSPWKRAALLEGVSRQPE